MEWVDGVFTLLMVVYAMLLFWFGKMVYAQKENIGSFKAQYNHVKNLQELVANLVEPKFIENVVNIKVAEMDKKYQHILKGSENTEKSTVKVKEGYQDTVETAQQIFTKMEKYGKLSQKSAFMLAGISILSPEPYECLKKYFEKDDLEIIEKCRTDLIEQINKDVATYRPKSLKDLVSEG